jgi:hypothetical protein
VRKNDNNLGLFFYYVMAEERMDMNITNTIGTDFTRSVQGPFQNNPGAAFTNSWQNSCKK